MELVSSALAVEQKRVGAHDISYPIGVRTVGRREQEAGRSSERSKRHRVMAPGLSAAVMDDSKRRDPRRDATEYAIREGPIEFAKPPGKNHTLSLRRQAETGLGDGLEHMRWLVADPARVVRFLGRNSLGNPVTQATGDLVEFWGAHS